MDKLLKKIKSINWKAILLKTPWFLGRHAFLIILLLMALSIALGGVLFYNYVILVKQQQPETGKSSIKFREDIYNSIINKFNEEAKENSNR